MRNRASSGRSRQTPLALEDGWEFGGPDCFLVVAKRLVLR